MSQTRTHKQRPRTSRRPLPPGPRGRFFVGVLPELRRDMIGLYRETAREYGDVVRLRFVGVDTFAVSHPDHFKHVLQDNNRNYRRNPFFNNIVKHFVGLNLFTADGDDWLSRRRLMQPAFHRQRLADFGPLMTGAAQAMLERWQSAPDGQRLDIDHEITRLTLRVAGQALFSVDLTGEASALGDAFTELSEWVGHRMAHPYAAPLFVPTAGNRRFKRARRLLDDRIYAMIRERRKRPEPGTDLLAMLMQARDADTGETMSDEQLHHEIAVMMFAGHETTAAALTWTFYLLSQHPEVEQRLQAELAQALAGRGPELADLANLPYNRMVIEESMRLYPPAIAVTRQSVEADEIGGYYIPPNASVSTIFINAHHDGRFWDEPERFDPERFTPERSANRPNFAYLPFGAGPRLCIGNSFAMMEAQLVLASIVQRFQLRLAPGHPVKPNPIFVLRTSHGLPMTIHKR
jgi:cytochrome P450